MPCQGAWRDFTLEDGSEETEVVFGVTEEYNNSYTDTFEIGGHAADAESALFRNVYVGAHRRLSLPVEQDGQTRIYYYGTRTIDQSAIILYGSTPVDEVQGITLDDLITPAVLTDYGDWDGDETVGFAELIELLVAILEDEYNPLFDYDCDGKLSGIEIMALLANWGSCHGDLNSDDQVDLEDLEFVVDNYGCTSSCSADLDDDDDTDVEDLKAWEYLLGCGVSGGYTIGDAMADIGLTASDWDDFLYHVENGTQAEHDNYLCWMAHYLECHAPGETCNGSTCTNDPFGGH